MGSHPVNLGFRFLLELAALVAFGRWGWTTADGALRFVLVIALPVAAAVTWGTFAVPDDPSRSGNAPVPVPGWLRIALELALFGTATWALLDTGASTAGWILGGVTLLHYGVSYDRIAWLMGIESK